MSETKRISEMVENWKKEGRAFSNVKNDDSKIFHSNKEKKHHQLGLPLKQEMTYFITKQLCMVRILML